MSDNYRKIERVIKGFANHRRIKIMDLLKKNRNFPCMRAEKLNIGYENASDHIRKLAIAGLIVKNQVPRSP